jgi:hypothetical protein
METRERELEALKPWPLQLQQPGAGQVAGAKAHERVRFDPNDPALVVTLGPMAVRAFVVHFAPR